MTRINSRNISGRIVHFSLGNSSMERIKNTAGPKLELKGGAGREVTCLSLGGFRMTTIA